MKSIEDPDVQGSTIEHVQPNENKNVVHLESDNGANEAQNPLIQPLPDKYKKKCIIVGFSLGTLSIIFIVFAALLWAGVFGPPAQSIKDLAQSRAEFKACSEQKELKIKEIEYLKNKIENDYLTTIAAKEKEVSLLNTNLLEQQEVFQEKEAKSADQIKLSNERIAMKDKLIDDQKLAAQKAKLESQRVAEEFRKAKEAIGEQQAKQNKESSNRLNDLQAKIENLKISLQEETIKQQQKEADFLQKQKETISSLNEELFDMTNKFEKTDTELNQLKNDYDDQSIVVANQITQILNQKTDFRNELLTKQNVIQVQKEDNEDLTYQNKALSGFKARVNWFDRVSESTKPYLVGIECAIRVAYLKENLVSTAQKIEMESLINAIVLNAEQLLFPGNQPANTFNPDPTIKTWHQPFGSYWYAGQVGEGGYPFGKGIWIEFYESKNYNIIYFQYSDPQGQFQGKNVFVNKHGVYEGGN